MNASDNGYNQGYEFLRVEKNVAIETYNAEGEKRSLEYARPATRARFMDGWNAARNDWYAAWGDAIAKQQEREARIHELAEMADASEESFTVIFDDAGKMRRGQFKGINRTQPGIRVYVPGDGLYAVHWKQIKTINPSLFSPVVSRADIPGYFPNTEQEEQAPATPEPAAVSVETCSGCGAPICPACTSCHKEDCAKAVTPVLACAEAARREFEKLMQEPAPAQAEQEEEVLERFIENYDETEQSVYEEQEETAVNTFFYCTIHTTTTVSANGNSYYCPKCGCTPERVISSEPREEDAARLTAEYGHMIGRRDARPYLQTHRTPDKPLLTRLEELRRKAETPEFPEDQTYYMARLRAFCEALGLEVPSY